MERSRAARQFPLFRSEAQARVLAAVFVAERPEHLSAIARRAHLPVSTVHREVDRLERAGLVRTGRSGRNRVVRPNEASPYFEDVRSIVLKTYGPPSVVAAELEPLDGIEGAYVYGSWAARSAGREGPAAQDVDVLVVGDVALGDVYDAARRAEARLGLEVNPVVVSAAEWERPQEGFLADVKSGPLVRLT